MPSKLVITVKKNLNRPKRSKALKKQSKAVNKRSILSKTTKAGQKPSKTVKAVNKNGQKKSIEG